MADEDRPISRIWKNLTGTGGAQPKGGVERRRVPRVRVLSALQSYGVDIETSVSVRDVSPGGFGVESPIAFTLGSEHTFLFATADGREAMVRCQCRHVRQSQSGAGTDKFVAGFEFLPGQQDSLEIIVEVYQRLRGNQSEK